MTMQPFADPSDVADIFRPLSTDEVMLASAWIEHASQQVRDEVPDVGGLDIDERVAAGTLAETTVRNVVARMVRRVLMNPEGARQRARSIDDSTESMTIDAALSTGELFISDRELGRLMGVRAGQAKAFSIDTAPEGAVGEPYLAGYIHGWY